MNNLNNVKNHFKSQSEEERKKAFTKLWIKITNQILKLKN